MSLYLKYRPRTIGELDLDKVRENLQRMAKAGNIPNSLLLVGPRGGGKTSTARIVAKLVNCQGKGERMEPCLECESCKSIESGGAIDVVEMDAASNRGIDAIRDLRDKINLAPVALKYKVYIIDEVHMLTTEAFNALLKTLEEPPAHARFILCTTEEMKVPETIRSRCTRVQFYKASATEVVRSLKKVVEGEKMKVDDEALNYLAGALDGSFREGHKLLEVLGSGGGKVGLAEIQKVLGVGGDIQQLVEWLIEGNTAKALAEIDVMAVKGVDWLSTIRLMLDLLRSLIKSHYGVGEEQAGWDVRRLLKVTEVVSRAAVELKSAVVEQLPLELAAVELGLTQEVPIRTNEVEERVEEKKPMREDKQPMVSRESVQAKEDRIRGQIIGERISEVRRTPAGMANVTLAQVMEKWGEVLSTLAPRNHSVAGLLRATKPKAVEDEALVLEVFYKFHKEQLEQDSKRRLLEDALAQLTGLGRVKLVLGERVQQAIQSMPEHDNVKVIAGDEELVKAVEEVFGG